jgi:hypothetical protein
VIQTATAPPRSIAGRTIRWSFEDGPTAGKTYQHAFHDDGSVEFVAVEDGRPRGTPKREPRYHAFEVAPGVILVSYLSDSGFTLTVAMSFADSKLYGFASDSKQWHPVAGTLEVVEPNG